VRQSCGGAWEKRDTKETGTPPHIAPRVCRCLLVIVEYAAAAEEPATNDSQEHQDSRQDTPTTRR
jgi:hypothetical protein